MDKLAFILGDENLNQYVAVKTLVGFRAAVNQMSTKYSLHMIW